MDVIMPKAEAGFTFGSDHGLTLNFDPSVHAQKLESGIYIPLDGFGQGIDGVLDNWTIIPLRNQNGEIRTNTNGRTLIGVNLDHVVCIYSLCRRKVTSRTNVANYRCSNETKTVQDVMDEFNCAMDAGPIGQGLPATSYQMTPGDLFQFHENPKPWIATNPTLGTSWACAMDDMNRYEDQVTQALFYVEEVEYNDPDRALYMTKLSLKCIWKETDDNKFSSYTVGQTYTAVKSI